MPLGGTQALLAFLEFISSGNFSLILREGFCVCVGSFRAEMAFGAR